MITEFRNMHYFLSSFDEVPFLVPDWQPYYEVPVLSREHAYQASKATCQEDWRWVLAAPTAREAQKRGRIIKRKEDWDRFLKKSTMFYLIGYQTGQNLELKQKLLATGDEMIIEGNRWHDVFWGACTCDRHLADLTLPLHTNNNGWVARGANWLGRMWMMHRDLLSEEREQEGS